MTPDRVAAAIVAVALVLGAVVAFRRRASREIADRSTITLFALVWGIALGVYAIPWIIYSRPTGLAWTAIYGSLITFVAGGVLAERMSARTEVAGNRERLSLGRLRLAIVVTALVGYIGFAFFLRAIDEVVGWRTIFTDLHAARRIQDEAEFSESYGTAKLLTYVSGISLLLWTVGLRQRAFAGRWRILTPLGLLVLLPYFFLGERLSLLTMAMWITAFHLVWRPTRSLRTVGAVAVVAVLGAGGFFYLVGYQKGATIQNHPQIRSHLRTQEAQELAFPYLYLTANIPVFSKLAEDPIAPRTYGALTLWPAAKASNLVLHRTDYPPRYGAFYNIPFDGYNSATWLGTFYRDFGLFGCLLMPALFGFTTTWLLILALRRRTLLTGWLAALGLTIIAFSPLKNGFSDASTWELVIAAPLVSYLVTQRSPESEAQATTGVARLTRRRSLRIAIGAAFIAGVVAVGSLNLVTTAPAEGASIPAVAGSLFRAAEKVARIYKEEGTNWSLHALATRLAVSDPGVTYEAIDSPAQFSPPGVIEVSAGPREFRLRSRTSDGHVLEVVGVKHDADYRLVGPREVKDGLVLNGGFEDPLGSPWIISSRKGVDVATTTRALDGAYSLRLQYRRPSNSRPTSVSQVVREGPMHAPGTRYTMQQVVLTEELSRHVSCGLQLIYRDGTSRYFAGSAHASAPQQPRTPGIPAGSRGPLRMTVSAVAEEPVSAIRVFSVDGGSRPLTGSIIVDDVRLTVKTNSANQ